MPDLGIELHLRRRVRIVAWDLNINCEFTSFINSLGRAFQSPFPMVQVFINGYNCKVKSVFSSQLLKFFLNSEFGCWDHYSL
jgi:hypothetical protein